MFAGLRRTCTAIATSTGDSHAIMVVLELARRVGVVLLGVGSVMVVALCYSLTVGGWHQQQQLAQVNGHYSQSWYSGQVARQHSTDKTRAQTAAEGLRSMSASKLDIDDQWSSEMASDTKSPVDDEPWRSHHQAQLQRHGCLDSVCLHFLSSVERARYRECVNKTERLVGVQENGLDAKCHFVNGSGRGRVALASFPGSGNTWIRSMLEAATGVCTGFYYCDMSLRVKGFAGEAITSSAVLVVKTHMKVPSWEPACTAGSQRPCFQSAIFAVRNPFDALVAEWNRIVANGLQKKTVSVDAHTRRAGLEYFGKLIVVIRMETPIP